MDMFEMEKKEKEEEAEAAGERRRQERLIRYAEKAGIYVRNENREDA